MALPRQRDLFTRRWRMPSHAPDKEVQLQIQLVTMLRPPVGCLKPTVTFFHVPNGEVRDKRTAAKLKAMGVLAGVADLVFLWKEIDESEGETRKYLRVLFLELKLPGRQATDSQIEFALAVRLAGAEYKVARSIDAALELLRERDLLDPRRKIYLPGARP